MIADILKNFQNRLEACIKSKEKNKTFIKKLNIDFKYLFL